MFGELILFVTVMLILSMSMGLVMRWALNALFRADFFWFGMWLADMIMIAVFIVEFLIAT